MTNGEIVALDAAILAAWSIVHSILASFRAKRAARHLMGGMFPAYRFLYVVFAAATLYAIYAWLPRPHGTLYVAPEPWFRILQAVQIGAVVLFVWALRRLPGMEFLGIRQLDRIGKDRTGDDGDAPRDEETRLEIGGMYGIVRHPLYVTSFVALVASPVMTVWLALVVVWVGIYFAVGSVFEERRLLRLHSEEYREYRRRVPRFVPGLRSLVPRRR